MNVEQLNNVVRIEMSPVPFAFAFVLIIESRGIIRLNTKVEPLRRKEGKEQSPEEQRKDWLRCTGLCITFC